MIRTSLTSLLEIMKRLDTMLFLTFTQNAGFFSGMELRDRPPERFTEKTILKSDTKESDIERVSRLETHCVEIGLTGAAATARKLLAAERQPETTLGQMRDLLSELSGRLQDELQASLLMFVEPAEYPNWTRHFGIVSMNLRGDEFNGNTQPGFGWAQAL